MSCEWVAMIRADRSHLVQTGAVPDQTADFTGLPTALSGLDFPGMRIRSEVAPGDAVAVGQVLFRDAKRPEIAFVSAIDGRVAQVTYGPRRTLSAVVVAPEAGLRRPASPPASASLISDRDPDAAGDLRNLLLARGLWPAFVARPFGGPPDPQARPDAIVVNAVAPSAGAPDPAGVLAGREADFSRGLRALTTLASGEVHVCLGPGTALWHGPIPRVRPHRLGRRRGWGRTGVQIHRLAPASLDHRVWGISYQDVAAIGRLVETGVYDPLRVVMVTVPAHGARRLVRVALGVGLRPLCALLPEAPDSSARLLSGSEVDGRATPWLGRHHDEITVLTRPARQVAAGQPIIPHSGLERVFPFDIPPVPLMRALTIGDIEQCQRLGCLEVLEDDVAGLSAICTSGTDYGRCLRSVLDQIRKDAA